MDYHDLLGISRSELEAHLEHFERREFDGLEYRHLPDYRGSLTRGTVLLGGPEGVVDGFPKIPRTLVLEEGIPTHFEDELVVEEKLDGYNVRVALVDDRILAFTRSGMVCPFTTHEVRKLDLERFFEDHPDLMVCGEMVGPENPYTAREYPGVESLAFRTFGLRDRATGDPLPVGERRDICEGYGIDQVPFHGRYSIEEAVEAVPGLVDDIDAEGREGVVMKAPGVDRQLKYTTSHANQGDLAYAFSLPFDYGQSFMFRRIVREAFQAVEYEEDAETVEARAHGLGESILEPMVETLREVQDGDVVGERHTVRSEDAAVEALLDHLRDQGLQVEIERDYHEDGQRVVQFLKVTRSTTDKSRAYLDGQIVTE